MLRRTLQNANLRNNAERCRSMPSSRKPVLPCGTPSRQRWSTKLVVTQLVASQNGHGGHTPPWSKKLVACQTDVQTPSPQDSTHEAVRRCQESRQLQPTAEAERLLETEGRRGSGCDLPSGALSFPGPSGLRSLRACASWCAQ